MTTFKKKDIKNYKPTIECDCDEIDEVENIEEEVEELDEFVTSTGGAISGDEKNVNNSEIKTSPQGTTDQFAATAIQPNRYLSGNSGGIYMTGARVNAGYDLLAKNKALSILENIENEVVEDGIPDVDKLSLSVRNKLVTLVDSADMNNMNSEEVAIVINYVLDKLVPKMDDNHRNLIKNKF